MLQWLLRNVRIGLEYWGGIGGGLIEHNDHYRTLDHPRLTSSLRSETHPGAPLDPRVSNQSLKSNTR